MLGIHTKFVKNKESALGLSIINQQRVLRLSSRPDDCAEALPARVMASNAAAALFAVDSAVLACDLEPLTQVLYLMIVCGVWGSGSWRWFVEVLFLVLFDVADALAGRQLALRRASAVAPGCACQVRLAPGAPLQRAQPGPLGPHQLQPTHRRARRSAT